MTDNRSLCDKMQHAVITPKKKERRVDIKCMALKEELESSSANLQCEHTGAQIGNSLTKDTETEPLASFLRKGQRWNVIFDRRFTSAKKRCAAGINTLQTQSEEDLNVEGTSSFFHKKRGRIFRARQAPSLVPHVQVTSGGERQKTTRRKEQYKTDERMAIMRGTECNKDTQEPTASRSHVFTARRPCRRCVA